MKLYLIHGLRNSWLTIIFAVLIVGGWYFISKPGTEGANTPEELVQLYLSALHEKNFEAINHLVPKDHWAEVEIREKINKFGGLDLTLVKSSIQNNSVNPFEHKIAVLVDKQNGIQIDKIYLQKYDAKRWYLILGIWKGLPSSP